MARVAPSGLPAPFCVRPAVVAPTYGAIVSHSSSRTLVAALALAVAVPMSAQSRGTIDAGTLDAAVAVRPATDRAALNRAFTSAQGQAAAARLGLTPDALTARIAALDDASARAVSEQVLAGGDGTIVISTTAIIIGLLLIILLTR
jgi:hypothetical protein